MKLREEKGFTYGARSTFDFRREPGPFSVQTSVQASATAEAIADSSPKSAASAATAPPTDEEIARARRRSPAAIRAASRPPSR